MKKILFLGIILVVLLSSCKKPVKYSVIPEIKLIGFTKYQDDIIKDGALLAFSFTDGDGDIGLNSDDTYPPFDSTSIFHYNFFCDYYEKQNGTFVKIDSIDVNGKMRPFHLNARIPRLSKFTEESINGEIYLKMDPYYNPFSPFNDTIRMQFYIVDRKLNKSNVEIADMIR